MRTIVAGSRDITSYHDVAHAIRESGFEITVVLSGAARGVDALAIEWANRNHVVCEKYPARWYERDGAYNRSAGFQRNQEMSEKADALVAVWDGVSRGTADMIRRAERKGLRVFVYTDIL